jgi:hypothetical protein
MPSHSYLSRRAGERLSRRAFGIGLVAASVWRNDVAASEEPPPAFRIIVHPQNPLNSLTESFVTHAFLKRATAWPDGTHLKPVDLQPSSAVRQAFSRAVLKRSVEAVRQYWQQRIFSGRALPPPELETESAAIEFVASQRGGIAYVSGTGPLSGVKVVALA